MLELKGIKKRFHYHFRKIDVLKGVDFDLKEKDFVALMGKSGSGKTTLLNIIAGLLKPSSGQIYFKDKKLKLFDFVLSRYRRNNIGFVFQNFNLINYLTVLDNVIMPLKFSSESPINQRKIGMEILEKVGLSRHAYYYPNMLSGGQLQRCAIARALINKPSIIIADEPTGNLDGDTADEILNIFKKLNEEDNISFLVVTHELSIIDMAKRVFMLENGVLKEEIHNSKNNLKKKINNGNT